MPNEEVVAVTKETLVANAPAITESINVAAAKMVEWLEKAESLVGEQVPHLVKEVLYFEVSYQGYLVGLGLLGLIWGLFAWRWTYRNAEGRVARFELHERALKEEFDKKFESAGHQPDDVAFTFPHFAIPISGAIFAVTGFFMIFCNIMNLVKPIVAPRVFLIEYFRALGG